MLINGLEKSYLLTTNGKKEFSPILLEILHSIGEECGSIPLEASGARSGHSYTLLPLCLMYLRSVREKKLIAMTNHYDTNSKIVATIPCQVCEKTRAEIFQIDGDYCLSCWQEKTHTNV